MRNSTDYFYKWSKLYIISETSM